MTFLPFSTSIPYVFLLRLPPRPHGSTARPLAEAAKQHPSPAQQHRPPPPAQQQRRPAWRPLQHRAPSARTPASGHPP
jgi:hypothetical protein